MVDAITTIELGTTDRQKLDEIIALLDTVTSNQSKSNAMFNAMVEGQGHTHDHQVLAAIGGAHFLIDHLNRDHFNEASGDSFSRLQTAKQLLQKVIAEATESDEHES